MNWPFRKSRANKPVILLAGSGTLYGVHNRPLARDERRHIRQQRETIFALARLNLAQRRKIKRLECALDTCLGKLFVARVVNALLRAARWLTTNGPTDAASFCITIAIAALVMPPSHAAPVVEINGRPGIQRHIVKK